MFAERLHERNRKNKLMRLLGRQLKICMLIGIYLRRLERFVLRMNENVLGFLLGVDLTYGGKTSREIIASTHTIYIYIYIYTQTRIYSQTCIYIYICVRVCDKVKKKTQMIQLVNKQIHKLISGKKFHEERKD